MKLLYKLSLFLLSILLFPACNNQDYSKNKTPDNTSISTDSLKQAAVLTEDFKSYWYQGEAEITSYALEQARYGEIRKGTAVLVFVTEPFLKSEQVKANRASANTIPILKLNATKNFNTGIYPYSIMQSVFYPVTNNQHALKISCSVQEWCGQAYMQLNNHADFEIRSHSYFEGEADEAFNLNKHILENELWTQLRIDPISLPTGNLKIIPAFEFLRLRHIPFKAYDVAAELKENRYTLTYPELNRSISITFNPSFPFDIISWEETFISGQGEKAQELTTKATRMATIKSAYWNKNSNADSKLRESLGLK